MDGHLGYFHVLPIVKSAAMSIVVHTSFSIVVLSGYMPRSVMAGSYSSSICSFLSEMIYFSSMEFIEYHYTSKPLGVFKETITKSSMAMSFLYEIPSSGFPNWTENQ